MEILCAPPRKRIRGLKKVLGGIFVGALATALLTSSVSAAGVGPYPAAISNKAVGDQLRITDFNSLLEVTQKLFVEIHSNCS